MTKRSSRRHDVKGDKRRHTRAPAPSAAEVLLADASEAARFEKDMAATVEHEVLSQTTGKATSLPWRDQLKVWVHAARPRELRYWFDLNWNIQIASDSLRRFLNLKRSWKPGQLFELQNYVAPTRTTAKPAKRPFLPEELWNKFTRDQRARYQPELIRSEPADAWLPIDNTNNYQAGVLCDLWMVQVHSERIEIAEEVVGRWVAVLLHGPLTERQLNEAYVWAHEHPLTERPPRGIVEATLIPPDLTPQESSGEEHLVSNEKLVEANEAEVEQPNEWLEALQEQIPEIRQAIKGALEEDWPDERILAIGTCFESASQQYFHRRIRDIGRKAQSAGGRARAKKLTAEERAESARKAGREGGTARAKKLTAEERAESARKAAITRWRR